MGDVAREEAFVSLPKSLLAVVVLFLAVVVSTYGSKSHGMSGKLGPLIFRNTFEVEDHLGEPPPILGLPLANLFKIGIVVVGGPLFRKRASNTLRKLRRLGDPGGRPKVAGTGVLNDLFLQWRGLPIELLSLNIGVRALLLGLSQSRSSPQGRIGHIGIARQRRSST